MKIKKFLIIQALVLMISQKILLAGPPFLTDDPEPVPLNHGEFYVASEAAKTKNEFSSTLPHLEANYGLMPNVQVHIVLPLAFDKKTGQHAHWGLGDIELGVKYRFIRETKKRPQIGTFLFLEIPSGDPKKELGNGKPQLFLPLLLQKSWGKWTLYGGPGYWINPGIKNKNWWHVGCVIQKTFSKSLWLGSEGLFKTAAKKDAHSFFCFNVGGGIEIKKDLQILFTVGRQTRDNQFLYYIGLLQTW